MPVSNRLTAKFVTTAPKGFHADGDGLYLNVKVNRRSWAFVFHLDGKRKEMGLGPAGPNGVSLAEARIKSAGARRLVREGINPIEERRRARLKGKTFGDVSAEFIAAKSPGWRNEKHRKQWAMTLDVYAKDLSKKDVAKITSQDVYECLKGIWTTKPETASRLRGRIENVLDAAKAQGLREGENPAAWKGNLKHLLPAPKKLSRGHHRALAYDDAPAFLARLRARTGVAAKALEFTILTTARTSEALGARWTEVDFKKALWVIPAERMKMGVEHRVPLSDAAVAILTELQPLGSEFVFPAGDLTKPLSTGAMTALLKRMNPEPEATKPEVTVHGFRSTFRDWAGETTPFPRDVIEMALAHKVGDRVERAYRRGDALEKRRDVMETWSSFLHGD